MTVVVWLTEDGWQRCVDIAVAAAAPDERIVVAHVTPPELHGATEGAFQALLGRRHRDRDPVTRIDEAADAAAHALLDAGVARVGPRAGPVVMIERVGQVEREIVTIAADARLLVCVRTGDVDRLGPPSLGHATRFVVDHAPCDVLLVWPGQAPDLGTLPPPHHRHGPRHHPPHPPPGAGIGDG